jgi:hypothetical protein
MLHLRQEGVQVNRRQEGKDSELWKELIQKMAVYSTNR